jgi:glycerophosphoryl diester phosphodiesterase
MSFLTRSRPLVFAHRGGCALGPENTLAAFDLGIAAGADGLELDVHLSADSVPVVHHDSTLNRTTDSTGLVSERTANELAQVDAGYRFSRDGKHPFREQGVGVPVLRDVLKRYRGVPIIVEMKVDTLALGEAVIRDVLAAGAAKWVCVAGEGARSTRAARLALREITSSATRGEVRRALYRSWLGVPQRKALYGSFQVPELSGGTRILSPSFIRAAHRAGVLVEAWTIDDEPDMERLLKWGVDALITNRPADAVRIRESFVVTAT